MSSGFKKFLALWTGGAYIVHRWWAYQLWTRRICVSENGKRSGNGAGDFAWFSSNIAA